MARQSRRFYAEPAAFLILEENVFQYEKNGQHIHQRRDLLALAGNHIQ